MPLHLRHEIGTLRRRLFPMTPNRYEFCTNNYAIPKTGTAGLLLRAHPRADAWFKSKPEARVLRLTGLPMHLPSATWVA